jgi:hypothetical protein
MNQITPPIAKELLEMFSSFPVFVNDPKEKSLSFKVVLDHVISIYDSSANVKMSGSQLLTTVGRGYFVISVNDHADKRERGGGNVKGVVETLLGTETSIANRLLVIPVTRIPHGNVGESGLEIRTLPSCIGFIQDVLRIAAATKEGTKKFAEKVRGLHSRTERMWPHLLYYVEQVGRCAGLTELEMRRVEEYVWNEMFPIAKKFQAAEVSFFEMTRELVQCLRADFFSEFPLSAENFLQEKRFGGDLSNSKPFIFRNKSHQINTDGKFWFRLDEYLKFVLKQHRGLSLGFAKMISEGDLKPFELFLREHGVLLKDVKQNRWDSEQKYKTQKNEEERFRWNLLDLNSHVVGKCVPKGKNLLYEMM